MKNLFFVFALVIVAGASAYAQTPLQVVETASIAPIITVQPMSNVVCEKGGMALSVTASGNDCLKYQWYKNGVAINGATTSVYTVSYTEMKDAGNYWCKISSGACTTVSNIAMVVVNSEPLRYSVSVDGFIDPGPVSPGYRAFGLTGTQVNVAYTLQNGNTKQTVIGTGMEIIFDRIEVKKGQKITITATDPIGCSVLIYEF
jgi:hypothetical protein